MMIRIVAVTLSMVVLPSALSNAQVYQIRTPPPPVSAQYATWQFSDDPIMVNGLVYYPTRETRFFDGQIMAQVGVYQSVPVYADVTLEAHSVIYIPVGRNLVRGYERKRGGELAGTVGSRLPAFPVDIPSSIQPREERVAFGVDTSTGATLPPLERELVAAPTRRSVPMHIESIPAPSANSGIWVAYDGSRWYSRGPAVSFAADRFTRIGEHRGFPVYRENHGRQDEIWIAVVKGGPVAPYSRR
jgi:hypothetical protein